jgi:hypothetical protein
MTPSKNPTDDSSKPRAPVTAKGKPASNDDPQRRQKLLIGGIGGAALVVAIALLLIYRPWRTQAPKLGGEPSKLGEYVGTADFQKLPFEKREIYMKMASAKKDEFAKAYAEGRLSLEDYQKSLLAAHLGKQLDNMRKYFAKPMGHAREKFLDKMLVKKESKKQERDHDPEAKQVEEEQDLLKDYAAETAEVATWPLDIQSKYKEYTSALDDRKKLFKEAKEAREAKAPKKGNAATAPVKRPQEESAAE